MPSRPYRAQLDAMREKIGDNPAQLVRLKKLRADIDQRFAQAAGRVQQRRDLGAAALDAKYITPVALQLMDECSLRRGRHDGVPRISCCSNGGRH